MLIKLREIKEIRIGRDIIALILIVLNHKNLNSAISVQVEGSEKQSSQLLESSYLYQFSD